MRCKEPCACHQHYDTLLSWPQFQEGERAISECLSALPGNQQTLIKIGTALASRYPEGQKFQTKYGCSLKEFITLSSKFSMETDGPMNQRSQFPSANLYVLTPSVSSQASALITLLVWISGQNST